MKYELYIYWLKKVFWINFFLSIIFAGFGTGQPFLPEMPFFGGVALSFTTFGYFMTVFASHHFGKRTKYMYFNRGVSLSRIYIFGFLFNFVFVYVVYFIARLL
ncbi:hypothetical protein GCM10017764_02790 [Sphingobacterium griseoflavum]|uniref:Uncharacterized protein n=1 Tax=Sphingobacterium griseoflavum TaxID=1474952 RepID=A0ABQ3HS62_9SPHI|nr:hypothetical protein GCM10017764_02790 [Sphingobacterium griseoflavum]